MVSASGGGMPVLLIDAAAKGPQCHRRSDVSPLVSSPHVSKWSSAAYLNRTVGEHAVANPHCGRDRY